MTGFTIISVAPELLNTNGDAENARVLATRIGWAGQTATVIDVRSLDDIPEQVDAVVIGSGSDSSADAAAQLLVRMQSLLRAWATDGVPILAVGLGWELISWGVELADGVTIEGAGVVAGRAVPRDGRVTGEMIVRSKYGRLVGFENHARDYIGAEGSPLGRIVVGEGNGRDSGQEGVVMGDVLCTHLHGPVLALNPQLADHIVTAMYVRRGLEYERGETAHVVDDYARAARNHIARKLEQELE